MKKNCFSNRRSLLQHPFIKIVIKTIVAIVKVYHTYQLLTKCYSTFFRQVYLRVYAKLFWVINLDFTQQTTSASDLVSSQHSPEEIGIKRNRTTFNTLKKTSDLFRKDVPHKSSLSQV